MSCHVSPWVYLVRHSLYLLDLIDYFFFHVGKIFNYNLFKNFFIPFLFHFFFWNPYYLNVGAFDIVPEVSEIILLFSFFLLYSALQKCKELLSSSSLIRSSASDILLLIPSRVFLISTIVLFVSVCLFFNSSRSL